MCWALSLFAGAQSATPIAAPSPEPLQALAQAWATQMLAAQDGDSKDNPLRPEIEVGSLDNRLQLAPCVRVEPFLPQGTRLWGRSRIGLRCVEGPRPWSVFLPITVKVWGPAWVLTRSVAPGEVLKAGDATLGEVDWADNPAPVVANEHGWMGATAARGMPAGQALRQNTLRPVRVFNAGTEVKVVVNQTRFNLTATGRALSHGFLGQPVRVKLESGKVISGRVKHDSTVAVVM